MKIKEEIEEVAEHYWDIKKISIGLVALIVLSGVGAYLLFGNSTPKKSNPATLGIQNEEDLDDQPTPPPLPSSEDVSNILNSAQSQLSNITTDNIVNSQKEIETVIKELQKLQLPNQDPIDTLCDVVCKKR